MSDPIGFANTIKPYFTAYYRAHMLKFGQPFDLWDPAVVQAEWNTIYQKVMSPTDPMPPTQSQGPGVWDAVTQAQFLKDFQAWKAAGFPP